MHNNLKHSVRDIQEQVQQILRTRQRPQDECAKEGIHVEVHVSRSARSVDAASPSVCVGGTSTGSRADGEAT